MRIEWLRLDKPTNLVLGWLLLAIIFMAFGGPGGLVVLVVLSIVGYFMGEYSKNKEADPSIRKCSSCGSLVDASAKFCNKCGKPH
jgi:uncharacterized membrane protein